MAGPRLVQLESASEIRAAAGAWDDLWQRSDVALPNARAELVAQWLETNAPRASVRALAVEQEGQFIAVLPLLGRRIMRLLNVGGLPSNSATWAGDLLVDPSADIEPAMELLAAAAVARLPWRLLWLDGVVLESARWTAFAAALEACGSAVEMRERFRVGQIEIGPDWAAYKAGWSGNHRHQMQKMLNRSKREGSLTLNVFRDVPRDKIESLLRHGFEVECRSWKGDAGTAVLDSPEMFGYYCRQARQLAEWGQLQLTYLELNGHPIAFEFGWNAKGVYCSPKVGYDASYGRLTPGQLLRHELLQRFFADPEQRLFDFVGPLSEATSKWITNTYSVGRLVASTERRGGRMLAGMLRKYSAWKAARPENGERPAAAGKRGANSDTLASAAGSIPWGSSPRR